MVYGVVASYSYYTYDVHVVVHIVVLSRSSYLILKRCV